MAKPKLLDRFKLAVKVYREGLPWNRWAESQHKAQIPIVWPTFRENRPEWHLVDYQAYVNEGFNLNSLIYSAVMFKARASTAAPLRAYTGELNHPEVLPAKHPLTRLVMNPLPGISGVEFQQLNTVYLNVSGNCFIALVRDNPRELPTRMYTLRPDRVRIIPQGQGLKGYLYTPEGKAVSEQDSIPILPVDMIHVKFPNPLDPLEGLGYGLSPLSPIAYSGDVDNDITRFLKIFFQNGTMTSTILKFENGLDDDTIAKIKNRWREMYGGYENWAEVGVLDNGGDIKRLGLTFEEMGFDKIDERNETRILGPLGVPPILIGTRIGIIRATYANYGEARAAFWEDTFIPEMGLFSAKYQQQLVTSDGGFVLFDMSQVPAIQQTMPKLVEAAHKLWQMGVPANRVFPVLGLRVGDIPGGDIGYIALAVRPVLQAANAPQLPADKPTTDPNADPNSTVDQTGQEVMKRTLLPFQGRSSMMRQSG